MEAADDIVSGKYGQWPCQERTVQNDASPAIHRCSIPETDADFRVRSALNTRFSFVCIEINTLDKDVQKDAQCSIEDTRRLRKIFSVCRFTD